MENEFETFRHRLKAETGPIHRNLETLMSRTGLTGNIADYGRMLTCFLGFYRPLEASLARLKWQPHALDFDERKKSQWLEADLNALGYRLEGITDWQHLPQLGTAIQGLGALYVIEGASLGGKIISRWLAEGLGIGVNNGGRFFSSYGARVGEMWRSYLKSVENAAMVPADAGVITKAAMDTFQSFHDCLRTGFSPLEASGTKLQAMAE